jgi:hypothetical protein
MGGAGGGGDAEAGDGGEVGADVCAGGGAGAKEVKGEARQLPARKQSRAKQTNWINGTSWDSLNRTHTYNKMYTI